MYVYIIYIYIYLKIALLLFEMRYFYCSGVDIIWFLERKKKTGNIKDVKIWKWILFTSLNRNFIYRIFYAFVKIIYYFIFCSFFVLRSFNRSFSKNNKFLSMRMYIASSMIRCFIKICCLFLFLERIYTYWWTNKK